jgi:adenosylcobinamide-phosphate synthase
MIMPVMPGAEDLIIILFLAYAYDLMLNEPPFAVHPVVWMGKLISRLKDAAPAKHRRLYGIFLALVTIGFASALAYAVMLVLSVESIPRVLRLLVAAYFLKATFAVRCLFEAGSKVRSRLEAGKLDEARREVSMYVSRDTSRLDENHVSSAIIETSSENYVDGILSPLMFYSFFGPFGLIAAYVFKATSTLDSMVGYKNEKYLKLGWFSARTDDVFNWIPARISVIFICMAAVVVNLFSGSRKKLSASDALKLGLAEGLMTPSPNSGFPMASTAGALRVRLEKPNAYLLGERYKAYPVAEDIWLTSRLILTASFMAVGASALMIYFILG